MTIGVDDIDENILKNYFSQYNDFSWQRLLDILKDVGGTAAKFATSGPGIAGLGGAALGFLDRAQPSGGGTKMAYPGAGQLTRKMVQGPYGPIAEYESPLLTGKPTYERFQSPTFPGLVGAPAPTPTTPPARSLASKVAEYKNLAAYGLPEERIRRIAEVIYGPIADTEWNEITSAAGVEGIRKSATGIATAAPAAPTPAPTSAPAPAAPTAAPAPVAEGSLPAYMRLTSASSPSDVASAYNEFISSRGGDTEANRTEALSFLSQKGMSQDRINAAYNMWRSTYGGSTAAPVAAPAAQTARTAAPAPVTASAVPAPVTASTAQSSGIASLQPFGVPYETAGTRTIYEGTPGFLQNVVPYLLYSGSGNRQTLSNILSAAGERNPQKLQDMLGAGVDQRANIIDALRTRPAEEAQKFTMPDYMQKYLQYKNINILPETYRPLPLDAYLSAASTGGGEAFLKQEAPKEMQPYQPAETYNYQTRKYEPNPAAKPLTYGDLFQKELALARPQVTYNTGAVSSTTPPPDLSQPTWLLPKEGEFAIGATGYATGGAVQMEDGGFVMTKRAVDGAGGPTGITQLLPDARMIRGPGTGTSDSIPAVINGRNGQTPARLSNGEAYVPPGYNTKGLYALMHKLERKA